MATKKKTKTAAKPKRRRIIRPKPSKCSATPTRRVTVVCDVLLASPTRPPQIPGPNAAQKAKAKACAEKKLKAELERICKLRSSGACRCGLMKWRITSVTYKVVRVSGKYVLRCTMTGFGYCSCM